MRNFLLTIFFFLCIFFSFGQTTGVTVSGSVRKAGSTIGLPYVNVKLLSAKDSSFVVGTITDDAGRFSLSEIKRGNYFLSFSFTGYEPRKIELLVGALHTFLDVGIVELKEDIKQLDAVVVTANSENKTDKRSYSVADNVSQSGGSVLQAMRNLPGVSVSQEGKLQLRGSEQITVLMDGKQTALTGFGSQTGLDNIPASAIERIEVINNPSAKYDANGNAGIINIIYKKSRQLGWNGKAGLTLGAGALWERKENLPNVRPQYVRTPKINPSVMLNHRSNNTNIFFNADWLYTETLNRNDFAERIYADGTVIRQQLQRNRNTSYTTFRTGADHTNGNNTFSISGLFNREKIIDNGDNPYFNKDLTKLIRLWTFLEDEVKYTAMASASWQHKFQQPGHVLNAGLNYTFHREDEKYFFTNQLPSSTGTDAFKLLSDEHVYDFNADYVRPLRRGRIEAGLKLRRRDIPINMQFFPGVNSVIDSKAGGAAVYKETIPALYSNYIFENKNWETEFGLRIEHVRLRYEVDPNHNTYKSDGYSYTQPFFNVRFGYKLNSSDKISFVYNRRVDRPNEVDIRIFPKYDEPELIKVGNPGLRPQFTNSFELGYRAGFTNGNVNAVVYHRMINATIVRIATQATPSTLLYHVFQNAGKSFNTGIEITAQHKISPRAALNGSVNVYRNNIRAFSVVNKYPVPVVYTADDEEATSGNVKLNGNFKLPKDAEMQVSFAYLAPDIIPQGRIESRFSVDIGAKKQIQKGKGELFLNANDLFNTLRIKRTIKGTNFTYSSTDYYETQVVRIGYAYKF